MKVTKEKLPNSLISLQVELDPATVEKGLDRAARRLSQMHHIPGFRRGKAPRFIVERIFGKEALIREATDELVNNALRDIIEREDIAPVGKPSLEEINFLGTVTFRVTIPVRPSIRFSDYLSYRFPLEVPAVTEEEVDRAMEMLLERHVVLRELDDPRPAQRGDQLTVKIDMLDEHRRPISAALFEQPAADDEEAETDHELDLPEEYEELGQGDLGALDRADRGEKQKGKSQKDKAAREDHQGGTAEEKDEQADAIAIDQVEESTLVLEPERLVREVYEGLLGASMGEYREIAAVIPEDHPQENLRSKRVIFRTKVMNIQERVFPSRDELPQLENFAGDYLALREWQRQRLQNQHEQRARHALFEAFIAKVVAESEFDIPEVSIEEAVDRMIADREEHFARYGVKFQDVLRYAGETLEQVRERFRPVALASFKKSLALTYLADELGIGATEEEITAEIEAMAADYPDSVREQVFDHYRTRGRFSVFFQILERKLQHTIIAIATGAYVKPEPSSGTHGSAETHDHTPAAPGNELDQVVAQPPGQAPGTSTAEMRAEAQ